MDTISVGDNESQSEALKENQFDAPRDQDKASGIDVENFACPVCADRQKWSETCRRCGANLTLVVAVHSELTTKRAQCLALIRQKRLMRATRLEKDCLELSCDPSNRRLVAMCYLFQGDFAASLRMGL